MACSSSRGVLNGPWVAYDDKNRPSSRGDYSLGLPQGKWLALTANQIPLRELNFYKGRISGERKEWRDSGLLIRQMTYERGKLWGTYVIFAQSGQPLFSFEYQGGKLSGEMRAWDEGGSLLRIAHYQNNRLEGKATLHSAGGVEYEFHSGALKNWREQGGFAKRFKKSPRNPIITYQPYPTKLPGRGTVTNFARQHAQFTAPVLSWVEIKLDTPDLTPVPGETYRLTLPNGAVVSGFLDLFGSAIFDEIPSGTCQVQFPKLPDDYWHKLEK